MSKIKNKDELSDFLDILDEFMDLDDCQFSFEELSTAANTFLRTAKGEVAETEGACTSPQSPIRAARHL